MGLMLLWIADKYDLEFKEIARENVIVKPMETRGRKNLILAKTSKILLLVW